MFILSDRVKETSSTVGSGSVALNGAYGAFQSFNQGIGNGNETYYAIENNSRWEVGKGVYTSSSNSLSRDVVLNSSASGAKINLEGISVVFCTLPASKATAKDSQGQVSLSGIIFSDSTVQTTAAVSPDLSSYLTSGVAASTYVSLSGSYTNPSWIVSIPSTKVTGLGTLATQSGTFSGTSSGTNTGDQTSIVGISGTKAQFDTSCSDGNFLYVGDAVGVTDGDKGDITVSVSGATWTIDSGVVSLAKLSDMATASVFYRKTAGSGTPEIQTLATLKTDLGLTGTNSGDQTTIVGISGTKVQFDTSVTDGNFLYVGDAPTSHAHGNITNAGAIGSTTGLPIVTTTSGVLTAGSFGTTAGTFAAGDDSRITGALSTSTAAVTYQPLDADLTSLAAASGSGIYERSGGNWTPVTIGTGLYLGSGTLSNTLDLSSYLTSSVASGTYVPLTRTLNTLALSADQTFAVGTTGTDFTIASSVTAHTFNIPNASATARGLITTGTQTIAGQKTFTSSVLILGGQTNASSIDNSSSGLIIMAPANGAQSSGMAIGSAGTSVYSLHTGDTNSGTADCFFLSSGSPSSVITNKQGTSSVVSLTNGGLKLSSGSSVRWGASHAGRDALSASDLFISRDAAGTLAQRNSTNAQTFRLYNTYTSSTSYETINIKGKASANFEIGPENGSAGGTLRGLTLGGYTAGSTTITPWLTFTNTGVAQIQSTSATVTGSTTIPHQLLIYNPQVDDAAQSTLAFGARTSGTRAVITYQGYGSFVGDGYFNFGISPASGASTNLNDVSVVIRRTGLAINQKTFQSGGGYWTTTTPILQAVGAAHTGLPASTEATDVDFNLARTVQFATGAITTQRAMRIQAPTYGFVGASTITTASTLSISGPPVAGTNATITNAYALNVESGYVNVAGGVLTGGTSVNAPTSSTPLLGLGGDGSSHGWLSLRGNSSASFGRYGLFYDAASDSTAMFGYLGRTLTLGHMSFAGSYTPGWFFTANTLQQRSGTTAQSFQVYNTYTSATSYECINIRGKASDNFEIGPESGDAGGTLRGLTLGGYTGGSATITPWLIFDNTGNALFAAGITALNLSGNNTGDQNLSEYLTIDDAATTYVPLTRTLNTLALSADQTFAVGTTGTDFAIESSGTAHTFNIPDASDTARGLITTDTQTIAGAKTFSGPIASAKGIYFTSEPTGTPSGTTQTLTLADGNHQTLALTSATGTVTATLTVPTGSSSGTIIVKQHASAAKDITWAVSAGTIKWMGTEPDWVADAISSVRIVSWRYDGSVMYLGSTEVAV